MKKIYVFLILLFLFYSCGKTLEPRNSIQPSDEEYESVYEKEGEEELIMEDETDHTPELTLQTEDVKPLYDTYSETKGTMSSYNIKKPVYRIPASYREDKVEFFTLDYDAWESMQIGVAGKDGVYLYEDVLENEKAIGDNLDNKRIMQIPKGTIIPILKRYENENREYDGLYHFKSEYNWWYKAEYNGKTGIIFGAYLAGVDNEGDFLKTDDMVRLSYYYTKQQKEERFYNHVGKRLIPVSIQNCLVGDYMAFEKVGPKEYRLNVEHPDDLVALYQKLQDDTTATMFITTDLLLHSLHLLFDRMLENVEENFFLPILISFVIDFLSELNEYEKHLSQEEQELGKAILIMKKYFQVAEGIMLVGQRLEVKENEYLEEYYYEETMPDFETDTDAIFSRYPKDVQKELSLIYDASSMMESPLFGYKEDYSQFKPRGHYTKSERLKTYFRTMMWFGRLHFLIDNRNKLKLELSKKMVSAVLLLTKIVRENVEMFRKWRALFEPISYIVGESDDWSFHDISTLIQYVDIKNLGRWLEVESNITAFIDKALQELRLPGIKGMSTGTAEGPSPGFRLFGQRFTIDSFIHNNLAIYPLRAMVKGLDIMGVFGSKKAVSLLKEDMERVNGYEKSFYYLRDIIDGFDEYDWRKTFYNGYLKLVKEVATFEKGAGFFFTRTDTWDKKVLLTAHAGWAELRHDTILYVKQSYAEMGGLPYQPTYSIDPVLKPVSYVEPNLGFFYWISLLLHDSVSILSEKGIMSEDFQYKFKDFKGIVDVLTDIVELEAKDMPITKGQNDFIVSVPYKLARIILPPDVDMDGFAMGNDVFKMPIIADVHTADGACLEVGTGIPYRLYVALNDGQGGKRIAIGYTFSYYEFTRPISSRLNDEEWREMVYKRDGGLASKIPEWAGDILCQ